MSSFCCNKAATSSNDLDLRSDRRKSRASKRWTIGRNFDVRHQCCRRRTASRRCCRRSDVLDRDERCSFARFAASSIFRRSCECAFSRFILASRRCWRQTSLALRTRSAQHFFCRRNRSLRLTSARLIASRILCRASSAENCSLCLAKSWTLRACDTASADRRFRSAKIAFRFVSAIASCWDISAREGPLLFLSKY